MRASPVVSGFIALALLSACAEPVADGGPLNVELSFSQQGTPHNFGTPLSGAEENPPVPTKARGNAIFQLSADGSTLHYKIITANIENVTQAHIHCGAAGQNGPIVVWLYPAAPPAALIPGRSDGVLNEGNATQANVIARPDSPTCPGGVATLADVLAKLSNGGAYANVHTSAFPPGEIRGQIEERSH